MKGSAENITTHHHLIDLAADEPADARKERQSRSTRPQEDQLPVKPDPPSGSGEHVDGIVAEEEIFLFSRRS
jgi:hypothetical protein